MSSLTRGQRARIERLDGAEALTRKLLEMGVEEGQEVMLMHKGPLGGDPLAFRLGDRTIALRRRDASHVLVELVA